MGKENKVRLVQNFLSAKRYSLEYGFGRITTEEEKEGEPAKKEYRSQEQLAKLIEEFTPPLADKLIDHIFLADAGASMWSNKKFEAELSEVVDRVE